MTPAIALALFGLITFATIAFEVMYGYLILGFGYGFSSKRPVIERSGFPLRIERVYRNQVESAAYIVPAIAAAAILGLEGSLIATTCTVILIGRVGFSLAYYTGLPFLRVPFFAMGSFGSLILIYQVVAQSAV